MLRTDLQIAARAARAAVARLARDDFDTFADFTMQDETTGARVQQAWFHRAWTTLRSRHDRLIILSFPEAGKTQQFASLAVHRLGRDPRQRIAIISRTQTQAIDIVSLIAQKIESTPEVREVFPELQRGTYKGARWNQTQLDVQRPLGIKEPSIQAFGLEAGAITGKRIDGFILDDILDLRTTRTKGQRAKVSKQFWSEIHSRASAGAWFVVIGNQWHPDDLYNELGERGWPTYRFPVVVTSELAQAWPEDVRREGLTVGSPTWPGRWEPERIARYERDLPPAEWRRAYLVHVDRDQGSPFKAEALDAALALGRELGSHDNVDSLELAWNLHRLAQIEPSSAARTAILEAVDHESAVQALSDLPDYERINMRRGNLWEQSAALVAARLKLLGDAWEELVMLLGVDPSSGTSRDPTALAVAAWSRRTNERIIVEFEFGWWEQPEMISRIIDAWKRWDAVVLFEDVGVQRWGQQTLQAHEPDMMVERIKTTGPRKASVTSGLPAFAHRFDRGLVRLCNNGVVPDAMQRFIRGAQSWAPEDHHDDLLMAAWFVDHWIYHRGERRQGNATVQTFG